MDNAFFTFIKPALGYVDKGDFFRRPFGWLYMVVAILNLLIPIAILYSVIDANFFKFADAKAIIVFVLIWLVIVFLAWLSFQLWWDRKEKVVVTSTQGEEFIATPVFSHLIQTFGEWLGLWVGVLGFAFALLGTIIMGDEAGYLASQLGIGFLEHGLLYIVLMPIYGFLIVVFFRFLAEVFRALTSLANTAQRQLKYFEPPKE